MGLSDLLLGSGSQDRITADETLPMYMRRVYGPPSGPVVRPADLVMETVFAEAREEARLAAAVDRQALLERIRVRKQIEPSYRLDQIEAQLGGYHDE
jgi:hypothetical protein